MGIDNTTRRMQESTGEKMAFLAESLVTGSPETFILGQERAGQHQLVNSDRLPTDFRGDRAEWEALGFAFGEPDAGDPMFMPATLPQGWKRQGSDHAMWSHLVDGLGRERAGIFYKAAFYDRSAFMHLIRIDSYVRDHVEYGKPLVLDGEWATREAVLAAMREAVAGNRKDAGEWRMRAAETATRDEGSRARCAEYAAEYDEKAAKYEAASAALEAEAAPNG